MVIDAGYRTHDRGEAEDAIGRVYRTARLHSTAAPFLFSQRVQGDDRATIGRYDVTSPSVLSIDVEGMLGIGMCAGGDYRATSNGRPLDSSQPFVLQPGVAQSSSDHHRLTIVNLDLPALASFAGATSENVTPTVASTAPISPGFGRSWQRAVSHAVGVFSTPELLDNDLLRRASVDTLCASALAAFAISFSGSPREREGDRSLPAAVRRAMRFMDDNAGSPIGIDDVAEAARMSVRGLQAAFRRTTETTPLQYLRTARLSEAHRELMVADPHDTTVTRTAHRWGFSNVSRFTTLYSKAYSVSPRDTLWR